MNHRRQPRVDFRLYLITDRNQTAGRDLLITVGEALAGGVRCVQLREKDLSSRQLYELALEMRRLTDRHNARLIINDRIDIAQAVDADGVHLGESGIPAYKARKILGDRMLIGVSCHNQMSAISAQEAGADFITFGPVYHTPSKAIYGAPVGREKLELVCGMVDLPCFALGGIKRDNAPEALATGAHGIALISAILAAPSPGEEAEALLALVPPMSPEVA